jgi:hypothetical protein
MSGSIGNPFSLFYQTKQSQLGYLYLDVMVTENLVLPSEVTKYPIEDGNEDVTDHITQNNEELTITGAISASKSFGLILSGFTGSGNPFDSLMTTSTKLINAIDQLRTMHKARQPITVYTGLGKYEDMAFTNLSINRQAGNVGGNWLDINASLRKIKKVALKESQLPPDKAADDGKGKTGQTERRSGKSGDSSQEPQESLALRGAKASDAKFGTHLVGPH